MCCTERQLRFRVSVKITKGYHKGFTDASYSEINNFINVDASFPNKTLHLCYMNIIITSFKNKNEIVICIRLLRIKLKLLHEQYCNMMKLA